MAPHMCVMLCCKNVIELVNIQLHFSSSNSNNINTELNAQYFGISTCCLESCGHTVLITDLIILPMRLTLSNEVLKLF